MIRVLSVSIYNSTKSDRYYYESFKDKKFESYNVLRKWREYLEVEWEKIMGVPCKAYPTSRAKPEKEIDMMALFMNTALVMGQPFQYVLRSSKREAVDVKKTACMILLDADYNPMDIERELPFKNRLVYDYRTKMDDRLITEPGYKEQYKEIKRKVLHLTLKPTNPHQP